MTGRPPLPIGTRTGDVHDNAISNLAAVCRGCNNRRRTGARKNPGRP